MGALEISFDVELAEDPTPGQLVRTHGPHGPVDVPAPANMKAGDTFQCRLKPPPELKVTVPPGFTGSSMIFKVNDGSKISVAVPKDKNPGDVIYVRPPAVLVRLPDGVKTGDRISFPLRGGDGNKSKVEWFRTQVPGDLQLGCYFVARLPKPENVIDKEESDEESSSDVLNEKDVEVEA